MSFLKVTPEQIRANPSNKSTAKQHYSFSKSHRFLSPKGFSSDSFYEIPSSLTSRKVNFGFGKRYRLINQAHMEVPESTKYEAPTSFRNYGDRKGFSFGYNRDQLACNNYLKQQEDTPSSHEYQPKDSIVLPLRAYGMRSKTAYPENYFIPSDKEGARKANLPGPGKYEIVESSGEPKSHASRMTVGHSASFKGGERFNPSGTKSPGPGEYKDCAIEADGIYLLSTMRSSGRRTMLMGRRDLKLQANINVPGPGQYDLPSDFGLYAKVERQRPKTAKK